MKAGREMGSVGPYPIDPFSDRKQCDRSIERPVDPFGGERRMRCIEQTDITALEKRFTGDMRIIRQYFFVHSECFDYTHRESRLKAVADIDHDFRLLEHVEVFCTRQMPCRDNRRIESNAFET